jgi:tRNA dimethylallyltransferase
MCQLCVVCELSNYQNTKLSNCKKVIIIAGPTAVGKTAVAIALARHFNTCIISADSRQCFREMRIGVARPSDEDLRQAPHFFIADRSIHEDVTAADFEKYALETVARLFRQQDTVIMAGGTGLYLKAFCEGLDSIPAIGNTTRHSIQSNYERAGINWLQQELKAKDPAFASSGEMQNPQRMMRALEVMEETGHSILHFQKGKTTPRDFTIQKIGLELPRPELIDRINHRVGNMMNEGLLDEVQKLLPYKELNALQTVGYKELFEYLDNSITLEKAVDLIRQHTRQYAKRQMTWFRKDPEIKWLHPGDIDGIIKAANN